MREILSAVEPCEDGKEASILRRGKSDAGVAQQQRETRREGGPKHHRREQGGGLRSVNPLHEERDDEVGLGIPLRRHKFPPGHNADDRKIHRKINHGHAQDAEDDGTRNDFARFFDLVADVTDVVIAEVIVNPDPRSRAQPEVKAD